MPWLLQPIILPLLSLVVENQNVLSLGYSSAPMFHLQSQICTKILLVSLKRSQTLIRHFHSDVFSTLLQQSWYPSSRSFFSYAVPSLQAQEPRVQFCWRQVFHHKLGNQGCSVTGDWMDAVASRCFLHLTLTNIWTDLKRSEKIPGAPTWRWGEWIWPTGSSGLHWNSPQGLNIISIRVFDQIRDLEIPITLHPLIHQSLIIITN